MCADAARQPKSIVSLLHAQQRSEASRRSSEEEESVAAEANVNAAADADAATPTASATASAAASSPVATSASLTSSSAASSAPGTPAAGKVISSSSTGSEKRATPASGREARYRLQREQLQKGAASASTSAVGNNRRARSYPSTPNAAATTPSTRRSTSSSATKSKSKSKSRSKAKARGSRTTKPHSATTTPDAASTRIYTVSPQNGRFGATLDRFAAMEQRRQVNLKAAREARAAAESAGSPTRKLTKHEQTAFVSRMQAYEEKRAQKRAAAQAAREASETRQHSPHINRHSQQQRRSIDALFKWKEEKEKRRKLRNLTARPSFAPNVTRSSRTNAGGGGGGGGGTNPVARAGSTTASRSAPGSGRKKGKAKNASTRLFEDAVVRMNRREQSRALENERIRTQAKAVHMSPGTKARTTTSSTLPARREKAAVNSQNRTELLHTVRAERKARLAAERRLIELADVQRSQEEGLHKELARLRAELEAAHTRIQQLESGGGGGGSGGDTSAGAVTSSASYAVDSDAMEGGDGGVVVGNGGGEEEVSEYAPSVTGSEVSRVDEEQIVSPRYLTDIADQVPTPQVPPPEAETVPEAGAEAEEGSGEDRMDVEGESEGDDAAAQKAALSALLDGYSLPENSSSGGGADASADLSDALEGLGDASGSGSDASGSGSDASGSGSDASGSGSDAGAEDDAAAQKAALADLLRGDDGGASGGDNISLDLSGALEGLGDAPDARGGDDDAAAQKAALAALLGGDDGDDVPESNERGAMSVSAEKDALAALMAFSADGGDGGNSDDGSGSASEGSMPDSPPSDNDSASEGEMPDSPPSSGASSDADDGDGGVGNVVDASSSGARPSAMDMFGAPGPTKKRRASGKSAGLMGMFQDYQDSEEGAADAGGDVASTNGGGGGRTNGVGTAGARERAPDALLVDFGVKEDTNRAGLRRAKKKPVGQWGGKGKKGKAPKPGMEDTNYCKNPFDDAGNLAVFSVFDGHVSPATADDAKIEFPRVFSEQLSKHGATFGSDLSDMLAETYKVLDKALAAHEYDGATGTTAVVWRDSDGNRYLQTVNLGDSEAMFCRNKKPVELTEEHNVRSPKERERLKAEGIEIGDNQTRLTVGLTVSRSLGDHFAKEVQCGLSAVPYVSAPVELTDADDFAIVASDGLWDVMTFEEACDFVHEPERASWSSEQLASALLSHALAQPKCNDNVTIVVIGL